jgi:hypothetical protein
MRHLLMDPSFPDIVGEWAKHEAQVEARRNDCANDNHDAERTGLSDPLLALVARAEVEATRLW